MDEENLKDHKKAGTPKILSGITADVHGCVGRGKKKRSINISGQAVKPRP